MPPIFALFAVIGMVSVPVTVALGVALVKARKEIDIRRELARGGDDRSDFDRDADRDRLERAIEAIALDVERITEGQRFMAKLLAERSAPGRAGDERPQIPGTAPRSITPH